MLFIMVFGRLAFQMYRSLFSERSDYNCHQEHIEISKKWLLDSTSMHNELPEIQGTIKKLSAHAELEFL